MSPTSKATASTEAASPRSELSAVAERLSALRQRRDDLVRQRLTEGASLRAVATEAGLTHAAVARIRDRDA